MDCRDIDERVCGNYERSFFNGQIWERLTTPFSYINTLPVDPFGSGLFYGFHDQGCSNRLDRAEYWLMFSAGPDSKHFEWLNIAYGNPYNPTNGITSSGDIWKIYAFPRVLPYVNSKFKDIFSTF